MSFILDALKKLEQKRQQGAVPNLTTDHEPVPQGAQKRSPWSYIIFGALLLNAVVLTALFYPGQNEEDSVKVPSVINSEEQKTAEEKEQQLASARSSVPVPAKPDPEKIPGIENTLQKPPDGRAASPSPKEPAASPQEPDSNRTVPADSAAVQDVPVPEEDPVVQDERTDRIASLNLDLTAEQLDVLKSTIEEEQSITAAEAPEEQAPSPDEETEPENSIPDLSELPAEIKNDLPDISVSAHIYSNNSQARLVNINGIMLREGDRVSEGLKVEEITVSGIVFDFRGTRFQIRSF